MIPLHDRNPPHGRPVLVYVLVAVNVLAFLYQLSLGESLRAVEFIFDYAYVPARFAAEPLAALHTPFTSAFLHGGWSHLIGNMVFLLVFGDNIEDRMGHWRFLLFYLVGAAAASLLFGFLTDEPNVPLVGASGAISAVLGAYIVLFPRQRVLTFVPPLLLPWLLGSLFMRLPRFYMPWLPAWLFIGYWALIQLLEAGNVSDGVGSEAANVAWWAHVGGFVFGLLIVRLLARPAPFAQPGSMRP